MTRKKGGDSLLPPNGPPGNCIFRPMQDDPANAIIEGSPPLCPNLRREWRVPHGDYIRLCNLVGQVRTPSRHQCHVYDRVAAARDAAAETATE